MPEMNKPSTSIPHTNINPVASLSKALDRGSMSLGQQAASRFQVRAAVHMQGQQHEHEKIMQAGQHAHEQNLALIGGATDMEVAKIQGRSAVHVARAQGASQVDIAKVQADSALKEKIAGQRHEIRLGAQQHQQVLEKAAQEHHLATGLVGSLVRFAEPGTDLNFGTAGGTKASFTTRNKPEKKQAPVAETPTPEPTPAAPEAPAKTPKYAHRDPITNKITHYEDTPQNLKPAKKSKKAAPKKKK